MDEVRMIGEICFGPDHTAGFFGWGGIDTGDPVNKKKWWCRKAYLPVEAVLGCEGRSEES